MRLKAAGLLVATRKLVVPITVTLPCDVPMDSGHTAKSTCMVGESGTGSSKSQLQIIALLPRRDMSSADAGMITHKCWECQRYAKIEDCVLRRHSMSGIRRYFHGWTSKPACVRNIGDDWEWVDPSLGETTEEDNG